MKMRDIFKKTEEKTILPPEEKMVQKEEKILSKKFTIKSSEPEEIYKELLSFFCENWNCIKEGKISSIAPIKEIIEGIANNLILIPELLGCVHKIRLSTKDYLLSHSLNVCLLSLYFGFVLGYPREKLINLGISSLLHDIGMIKISPDIYLKKGALSAEEKKLIQKHARLGWEMLSKIEGINEDILAGIYYHHERENGGGYPEGYRNGEIHEFSRIVGLCDTYESMTHLRVHRDALPPYDAIKEILASNGSLFAQNLLQILIDHLTLYPVGSLVQLSTKEIARVRKSYRSLPSRPEVEIILDKDGNKVSGLRILNLLEDPSIFIKKAVKEDEEK